MDDINQHKMKRKPSLNNLDFCEENMHKEEDYERKIQLVCHDLVDWGDNKHKRLS